MAQTQMASSANALEERERNLDWLTALLPLLLLSWFYYGRPALWLELLAVGGYLMAARLLQPLGVLEGRPAAALVMGLLTAFCLPSTAPYWAAALAGGLAAAAMALPCLLQKRWPQGNIARPLLHPALLGYWLVQVIFPRLLNGFMFPIQWRPMDGVTTATPLATEGGVPFLQLLFGIHSGSLGGTCEVLVLMAAAYLLLRRRLRLLPPLCMLGLVSVFSWFSRSAPLEGLVTGGTMLAALLLADKDFAPDNRTDGIAVGVTAGIVIMSVRGLTGYVGTAAGVLAAGVIRPLLPSLYRFFRWVWRWLLPALRAAWAKVCAGVRWVWPRFVRLCARVKNMAYAACCRFYKKIAKKQK